MSDKEAEEITGGKIVARVKPPFDFSQTNEELIRNFNEELDAVDVSDSEGLEFFGALLFKDIQNLQERGIPENEINKMKADLKTKWTIFSNGRKYPFDNKK